MEESVAQQGKVYLRRLHQIHFQESSLQVSLILSIVFQCVEQERCALLNQILLEKHIDDLREISHGFFVLNK